MPAAGHGNIDSQIINEHDSGSQSLTTALGTAFFFVPRELFGQISNDQEKSLLRLK